MRRRGWWMPLSRGFFSSPVTQIGLPGPLPSSLTGLSPHSQPSSFWDVHSASVTAPGSVLPVHHSLNPVHIVENFGVETIAFATPDAPGYDACGHPVMGTIIPYHIDATTVPLADTLLPRLISSTEHVVRKHLRPLFLLEPGFAGLPRGDRQL